MRPGTPQFVGERLRQAREARGLTALALSELVGVSRQAIGQYETGPETPGPETMRRIADVLRLPTHFFLRPIYTKDDAIVFYRSMASATKSARARAERRFDWTRDLVRFIRLYVNFPKANYPEIDVPADPLKIDKRFIEDAAEATRRHWKLGDGPISDLVLLLENNGTIIVRHDLAADTLDAFSMWPKTEESPYVVLNSSKGVAVRSRMDVAHELGHLILHRNIPSGCLTRPEIFEVIESQAFAFAGAFLMPEKTFGEDAISPTLDTFRALKSKWRTAIQAMVMRAIELRLLSPDQESRIWPNLARRGWRKIEPLDDSLEPELPRLLRRSVELMFDSRAMTRTDFVFQNALSHIDIEELIGLPRGYLESPEQGFRQATTNDPTILRFPSAG